MTLPASWSSMPQCRNVERCPDSGKFWAFCTSDWLKGKWRWRREPSVIVNGKPCRWYLVFNIEPKPEDYYGILLYNLNDVGVFYVVVGSNHSEHEINSAEPYLFRTSAISVYCTRNCSFGYTVHPLHQMPVSVETEPTVEMGLLGTTLYNCSHPYTVPDMFRCDMVQQCVGGEDEPSDCHYRSGGCGHWIPYRNKCLKIVTDSDFRTANGTVAELCWSRYGAREAELIDKRGTDLVLRLMKRSGHVNDISLTLRQMISASLRQFEPASDKTSHLFRFLWKWRDRNSPFAYHETDIQRSLQKDRCSALQFRKTIQTITHQHMSEWCNRHYPSGFICMKKSRISQEETIPKLLGLKLTSTFNNVTSFPSRQCADGSHVQTFYPCSLEGQNLGVGWSVTLNNVPVFSCTFGHNVPYSLVCDGIADCADGSDEIHCDNANFRDIGRRYFRCVNSQLVPSSSRCDGHNDCFDHSDEQACPFCNGETALCYTVGCVPKHYASFLRDCGYEVGRKPYQTGIPPPAIVELDGFGLSDLKPMNKGEICPESHFQCRDGYCIPTYLANNGELDCPHGEDENIPQENFTCPGFYRCYVFGNCLHSDYVCDGIYHCPNKDDERYCNLTCPANCTCEGHAYTCQEMFDPLQYLEVRYLDLSGTAKPSLSDIHVIPFLIYLNVSWCGLTDVTLTDMPLLQVLDLSFNEISRLPSLHLAKLSGLRHLNLSGNPLPSTLGQNFASFTKLGDLAKLESLVVTDIALQIFESSPFLHLEDLTTLDLSRNFIHTFEKELFKGLKKLQLLKTDNPSLCCEQIHPNDKLTQCLAPTDELSSCSDLLRFDFFRVFLWGLSLLAVTGNAGVLIYRLFLEKVGSSLAYRVLVVNLSVSDLLMGVYLAIVGAADEYFRGDYVWQEAKWKHSGVCHTAGFLAFVSGEVSALTICLITLDRFLVLRFPFSSHLHLTKVSALSACAAIWGMGVALAIVPLVGTDWQFYGQTSICLPLPILRRQFEGQSYAFGVYIVLNFVLFLLIGLGQVFIFHSIHTTAKATQKDSRQQEVTIARRLFLIIFSDFCCWFPIGLMGLLASSGTPIPGVVNVWAAIFVLPLNSALNPFLYTLNTLSERLAKKRMLRRIDKMLDSLLTELCSWPTEKVEEHVRYCITVSRMDRKLVFQWLGVSDTETDTEDHQTQPDCQQDPTTSCPRPLSF